MPFRFGTRQSLGLPIGGGGAILKPQDVFAILAQPANAMQAAINALPFMPDLLIGKDRVAAGDWAYRDSLRGLSLTLASNTTAAEAAWPGYSGTNNRIEYAFKQQAGVVWRVTWTGDGTSNRQIPHGLGVVPGMIGGKRRSGVGAWIVIHRSLNNFADYLRLNTTDASAPGAGTGLFTGATASSFTVDPGLNASGETYVAYLFAHDPSADGIVQCGVSTADGSGTFVIPHGWANGAQWIIYKNIDAGSTDWQILDTARGSTNFLGGDPNLRANLPAAEPTSPGNFVTASQGAITVNDGGANNRFVWAIIRAPY